MAHLLHEEDEDLPEELDEVDEEVEGVADGVLVAPPPLLDDGLGAGLLIFVFFFSSKT